VLTDILLPGAKPDSISARQIRAAYPQIALLLATGFSASAEEALREGFLVLRKPYGRDDSPTRLAQVLRGGCRRGARCGRETRLPMSERRKIYREQLVTKLAVMDGDALRALPDGGTHFDPTRGDWKPGKYDLEKRMQPAMNSGHGRRRIGRGAIWRDAPDLPSCGMENRSTSSGRS